MRLAPSRYTTGSKPIKTKRAVAKVDHVSAPVQGLNLLTRESSGAPQTAPILTNFTVMQDHIECRAGYAKLATHPDGKPIQVMIPWYGTNSRMAASTNHKIIDAHTAAELKTGFNGDDWSWTSFANLGSADYTIMCNGIDGVWSWDGGSRPNGAAVTVTSLSNSNPAVCTVGTTAINNFTNGQMVLIAGADTAHAAANGNQYVGNINAAAGTFQLLGVDTSSATAAQTTGVTATPLGSFVQENIIPPVNATWCNPSQFQIVLSAVNRLWFADTTNLAAYYLPLQQKSGQLHYLPLNALFKKGGTIRAMYTWTYVSMFGVANQVVIFTSNGEAAIYMGTDPDDPNNWALRGIYRADAPMSKRSVANWGMDLYIMNSQGVVPMSTLIQAEADKLGTYDLGVRDYFYEHAVPYRSSPGWEVMVNPWSNRLICNVPTGLANQYQQMIRNMPQPVWSQWQDIPARCWGWADPNIYFGDDQGNTYYMHPSLRSDNNAPIRVDVQCAWSNFGWDGLKDFKLVRAHIVTDGTPHPKLEVKKDYDYSDPVNQPDITYGSAGASWDTATWDVDYWAGSPMTNYHSWEGCGGNGVVGGVRLTALILNASFSVYGFDIVYEPGAIGQ
jgi:hypothetical protein